MTANDVIFVKWPKTVPAMLRSELFWLCNILIYCPELCTFSCFKCLSFISSLQPIRFYISCHFPEMCCYFAHDTLTLSSKWNITLKVKSEIATWGEGGFHLFFWRAVQQYHWIAQLPTNIFQRTRMRKSQNSAKIRKYLSTKLTLFILNSFYWNKWVLKFHGQLLQFLSVSFRWLTLLLASLLSQTTWLL